MSTFNRNKKRVDAEEPAPLNPYSYGNIHCEQKKCNSSPGFSRFKLYVDL